MPDSKRPIARHLRSRIDPHDATPNREDIHSHPGRLGQPSAGDEVYAERILDSIDDLDGLWLPIVNTVPDTGEFRLTPWVAYRTERGVDVVRAKIRVVDLEQDSVLDGFEEGGLQPIRSGSVLDQIVNYRKP